jgi:DNA-binding CsgD family transcriptional regulator
MTALHLSAGEQARLAEAFQILLSPDQCADLDAWRAEVNRAVLRLLGADKALFQLPVPGIEPFFSEEADPLGLSQYPARYGALARRLGIDERKRELKVYNREIIWGAHLDLYLASEYYNDLLVPRRYFDAIEMTVPLGAEPGHVATLWCHHERETGTRFGERGLALLRLLYPAFQCGVQRAAERAAETPVAVLDDEAALGERFGLSRAEAKVARLLAEGCTNAEISKRLFISPHTARHHTEKILRKMGVASRTAATARLFSGVR